MYPPPTGTGIGRWAIVAWLAVAGACNDAGATRTSASTSTTSDEATSTTTTSGGIAGPDDCEASEDCGTTGACVAPYDPGTVMPGQSVCVQTCIEAEDLSRWCIDDDSCCDGMTCNSVDGFCLPPDAGTTSSTSDASTSSGQGSSSGTDGTGSTTTTDSSSSTSDSSSTSTSTSTSA